MVAVEESLPVVVALPLAADDRTESADPVAVAEAVALYEERALAQYEAPKVITLAASEVLAQAWFAQSRTP